MEAWKPSLMSRGDTWQSLVQAKWENKLNAKKMLMVFQAFNEWHNSVGLKENPKKNKKIVTINALKNMGFNYWKINYLCLSYVMVGK